MDELLFTSASILDLLASIDELSDMNIDVTETNQGINITIGSSTYQVSADDAVTVEADPEVVAEIDDIASDAYYDMANDGVDVDSNTIAGGPIKELLKTLFIGGMVRMTSKMLKK